MTYVLPLCVGTLLLLLCLFAMGAFALCEPLRRDDRLDDDEAPDEPDWSRRALLTHLKLVRNGGRS